MVNFTKMSSQNLHFKCSHRHWTRSCPRLRRSGWGVSAAPVKRGVHAAPLSRSLLLASLRAASCTARPSLAPSQPHRRSLHSFLPGSVISAVLPPGPFVTRDAVHNRMDRQASRPLAILCLPRAAVLWRLLGWPELDRDLELFHGPQVGHGAPGSAARLGSRPLAAAAAPRPPAAFCCSTAAGTWSRKFSRPALLWRRLCPLFVVGVSPWLVHPLGTVLPVSCSPRVTVKSSPMGDVGFAKEPSQANGWQGKGTLTWTLH